ncbi:uncharacterized protein FIESC28_09669 [Fusarium coffeatum]|uniref:Glycosyl transferase 64 domain-containing protein n=1 Tax=Fusarium coffeatum TaxID=231269 RepID=A0A366QYE6_9HYPO|nr:uncharacterized protein FIESC28_09669 [Fusarium coffeatum]RBR09923.1 hypothetical protein FIESC28_09669 [Fusarium coffeatum]
MANQVQGLPSWRLLSRISVILFTFYVVISLITVSIRGTEVGENLLPTKPSLQAAHFAGSKEIDQQDLWNEAKVKYSHLADDKFTIAMLTYRRPKELNHTLAVLLEEKIPSLHEIVIIWGDIQADMPKSFKSKHNVPVRFRMAFKDSLNEKLRPDPQIETQAVLLTDDDVYYRPKDLEFVFQSWRKFGRYRLTGALARCADVDAKGTYNYNFCSGKQRDSYSMILTNLCFSHMSFLDYYWSNDRTMVKGSLQDKGPC